MVQRRGRGLVRIGWACMKVGTLAFGGGNAAIPLLEGEVVPTWLSPQEYTELVGVTSALPGATIVQLAAATGMRVAGIGGALLAVMALAAPGLALTIAAYGAMGAMRQEPIVARALLAMQYAAVALLASSAFSALKRATGARFSLRSALLTGILLVATTAWHLPPVVVILLSLPLGLVLLPAANPVTATSARRLRRDELHRAIRRSRFARAYALAKDEADLWEPWDLAGTAVPAAPALALPGDSAKPAEVGEHSQCPGAMGGSRYVAYVQALSAA